MAEQANQVLPAIPPEAQQDALVDPLPEQEEVIQVQNIQEGPAEEANIEEVDIIAMDEAIDSDDEFFHPPAPIPQPEIQVNIPVLQNP